MTLEGKSELFQILGSALRPSRSATPSIDYPSAPVYGQLSPHDGPTDNERVETARTALAEFGRWLGSDDTELTAKQCRDLLGVAMEIVDAQPHGLDCPRGYDDYDCKCHLGTLWDEMSDALDGLPR